MKKFACTFLFDALVGALLVMLYLHRRVIAALIRGEEVPKAPEGCPAYQKET